MTPERWEQISEVLSVVLDQDPSERSRYLKETLSDDPQLLHEVLQALQDIETAQSDCFLEAPAWIVDDIPLALPDFGSFSRIQYIGHGGMGVVYRAYHNNLDIWIALKWSLPSHLTTADDRERFRREAQNMARLKHPNIVPVHETGEHEGRPYFTMDLIHGESLQKQLDTYREEPPAGIRLLEAVSRAVHHAHQRQVLHCDLKPANILLDRRARPHVTDFGLARRLRQQAPTGSSGSIEGTVNYMSPEQAAGEELTTASDVHGLGGLLYALLTGGASFRGDTPGETLTLVKEQMPKAPSLTNPRVDKDLEAICLKCLRKDKAERYGSAYGLVQDLARYRRGEKTTARVWSRRERLIRWCRRNPVVTSLVAAMVTIAVLAVAMAFSIVQARKAAQLETHLKSIPFAAGNLASTALLQLRDLSRPVELAASDPKLAVLLAKEDRDGLRLYLEKACSEVPSPFETCFVLNKDGVIIARLRPGQGDRPADATGASFSWRDYFHGSKWHMVHQLKGHPFTAAEEQLKRRGRQSIHISRVYRGKSDALYKFAISAPIWDNREIFLGVIATSVTTDATMGLVTLPDDRVVALIAPRDVESAEGDLRSEVGQYVVLFHPAYGSGVPPVDFPVGHRSPLPQYPWSHTPELEQPNSNLDLPPSDDYRDPVSSVDQVYRERWIAGFAPVGNTHFFVIVQQRFEEALRLNPTVLRRLWLWSVSVCFLLVVAILAVVLWSRMDARKLGEGEFL